MLDAQTLFAINFVETWVSKISVSVIKNQPRQMDNFSHNAFLTPPPSGNQKFPSIKHAYELSSCNKLNIAELSGHIETKKTVKWRNTLEFIGWFPWQTYLTVQGQQGPWLTSSSAPAIASRIRCSSRGLEQWAKFKDWNCIISSESPLEGRYTLRDLSWIQSVFVFPWAGFKILM